MKKRIKHLLFRQDRMGFQYAVPIAVISLLLVSVLAALLLNTMGLDRQLQENTERYADDVSGQLAKNISSRMSLRETYLRSLADTISRIYSPD